MAKFRTNHSKGSRGDSSGTPIRVGIFAAIVAALFFIFQQLGTSPEELLDSLEQIEEALNEENPSEETPQTTNTSPDQPEEDELYLPSGGDGQIVRHKYYTLAYSEEHEQAEWVAYELTKSRLYRQQVDRTNDFRTDPLVETGSADLLDYRRSGYDRGHLVPAADMAWSETAMSETFYMSNISPQARNFNGGIWRELEELSRTWAKKFKKLYVVTGPVLNQMTKGTIGRNKVTVPAAYFKVLLDIEDPEMKGIGFVIPNKVSFEPLYNYAMSIDDVELLTGLNFYPDLMPANQERSIERNVNTDLWHFSKQKHDLRVQKWNLY